MQEKSISREKKIYEPHPKTELCLALNLARHRFIEILRYVKNDNSIKDDNWKSKVKEFSDLKRKNPTAAQQELLANLSKYLPFIRPENDNIIELNMAVKLGDMLDDQRNFYSHAKHKPIEYHYVTEYANESEVKKLCDLFSDAIEKLVENKNNTYTKDDMQDLYLGDDRRDKETPSWLNMFIAGSEPRDKEYALFYKSAKGYELSKRGAVFFASLFLNKKEAVEFLSGITGFKKTEGENRFKATRDVFTYYSGKAVMERKDTKYSDTAMFFNMVEYLDKTPKIIKQEGEGVREKELFFHYAVRYLLYNDDIEIRQFTGTIDESKETRKVPLKSGKEIEVKELKYEKKYSKDLESKIFQSRNNIYFKYNKAEGQLGEKATTQLVFAKLLRNEPTCKGLYDEVKQKLHRYISQYMGVLKQVKAGTVDTKEKLTQALESKLVKEKEIPEKIRESLEKSGEEDANVFIGRVVRGLEKKKEGCERRLKELSKDTRVYDMVTFMLQSFMDLLDRNKRKPGKGLYERLHHDFTFYGRYGGKVKDTLKHKYPDFHSSILSRALDEKDLHKVYKKYLEELKNWYESRLTQINRETEHAKKLHIATEVSTKIGLNRKKFAATGKPDKRTSSAKDIADMLLDKPIPLPDNLISQAILEKIKITKDGKEINRLGTLIDIYLPDKGFDCNRSDKEKNVMLAEYYHDIDNKYKGKEQKKIRLSRTQDKLIRLIIGEYAKGFIKDTVKLEIPDDIHVTKLYHSEVVMDFYGRNIKFPFDKYNKVKKLIYDKRIGVITKFHIDEKIKVIEYKDVPEKKSGDEKKSYATPIDEQKELYKKSQKRLISEALKFEEAFWEKNDFDTLLKKYTRFTSHIEHKNILKEAKAKEELGIFRNNALHNDVPETQGYFKNAIEQYDRL